MRIAYVLTSLGVGGAERQALGVADRMARRGHEVAILSLSPQLADEWSTDLRVIRLNMHKSVLSGLRGLFKARKFLHEFSPDILHSHSFHANIVARLLKLLVPSIKVVSTIHNVYEGGWSRMMTYGLTDSLCCQTTAVSQAAADRFVELKAVPRRKCTVLLNGFDINEFMPNADRRAVTRETLAARGDFIWLAAGRLVAAKDYPNLLRAFRLVRESFPATRLWIAGVPVERKAQWAAVGTVAFASDFTAEPDWMYRVTLLGLRRDLRALFDAADGFVLSSAWEGMPLVVGEAMAMEKPVVATDVGGTRELVGDAGTIVPAGNSKALALAMLDQMRQTSELRLRRGQVSRARIASHFSLDTRADEWEELYRNAVGAGVDPF